MRRHEIADDDWKRIEDLLPGRPGDPGVTAKDNRLFVNAVLWIAKTGAPWRDLPERFGPWNSVWSDSTAGPRRGSGSESSRHCKTPTSNGSSSTARWSGRTSMRPGKGGQDGEALGRSRGGFSTKLHILVDGLGNPVRFILTPGQDADVTQAGPLIKGQKAEAYILDKAYDSDAVVAAAEAQGGADAAVIPSKKNRKVPRDYDKHLYKERKKIEWFISLLKQYRRVATRYEKTGRNFLGFVYMASIMVLLR